MATLATRGHSSLRVRQGRRRRAARDARVAWQGARPVVTSVELRWRPLEAPFVGKVGVAWARAAGLGTSGMDRNSRLAEVRRRHAARVAGRAGTDLAVRHVLPAITVIAALLAVCAPSASADWSHIARTTSLTQPYFACPQSSRRAHCMVIEDPTRGTDSSGRVAAGAITAGPELEASPALAASGEEGGFAPPELQSAYDLPSGSAGTGQTVAVVDAYDDPDAESDLANYRSHYKLSACTKANECFRKINQTGGSTPPEPGEKAVVAAWVDEISLDLDMVSATCPNCHILLVEANSEEEKDLAAAENEAVKAGATEISNSYDIPEASQPAKFAADYDHPGIPITAAGGDFGWASGVESPAANPWVIAVGGTALKSAKSTRGWSEEVWYEKGSGDGTGSGCSEEPKPSWQLDPECTNRTTNDVAAVGDPNTPVSVYDSYETSDHWRLVGGTSVATPIVAAAMALAGSYTKSFAGASALYLDDELEPQAFNDVVTGVNGSCGDYLCEAEIGYDGPSGLGSLNGAPEVPPPTAQSAAPEEVAQHSATLVASVNPEGIELEKCQFEYGEVGAASPFANSAPCAKPVGSGTFAVKVRARPTTLRAGREYEYRIAIAFHGLNARGGTETFRTQSALPPSVETEAATDVTQTTATLRGEVNPEGEEVEECEFEYGTTSAYGSSVPCSTTPGAVQSSVAVSAALSDLSPDATYYYRLVAQTAVATSHGENEELQTPPDAPTVVTEAPSGLAETRALLSASVNPNDASVTSCEFQYGTTTLSTVVPCAEVPAAGTAPVPVSASVLGLAPATTYSYRVMARNAGGASYGAVSTFTTIAPLLTRSPLEKPITLVSGGPPPTEPSATSIEIASAKLTAGKQGMVSVALRCETSLARCAGKLTLRTAEAVKAAGAGGNAQVLTLGAVRFSVADAAVSGVRLRLSAKARRLLARARALRVRVTVADATSTTHALVTLHAARSLR